jgi:hypothetical protein
VPPSTGDPNRIGVVFVHGIGTQPACGTFLDWSGPIVDLLTDWRRYHEKPGDPVVSCAYDQTGAQLPFLDLEILEYAGHPTQHWVITEAWWAQSTRSPTLPAMTGYMRKALRPAMAGISHGYRLRERAWSKRVKVARGYAAREPKYEHRDLVLRAVPARRRDWIDWLDWIQMKLTALAFVPIYLLSWLVLLFYDPFRRIPIKALKDAAPLKSADNFLTRWFGGLPSVADNKIQSANVRMRLVNAIRGLRAQGCGRIVVVAHSGGAIVSFETLCDPAYRDEPVDKLVTLGEGLSLAWRIGNAGGRLPGDSRLRGDLRSTRPNLRWVDFWSTYDPAPAGPIRPPHFVKLVRRDSHVTVNRMSILEDHGAYWDNDEEFLIPLLQDIDTPTGQASDSRFFRDTSLATVRASWRRQRVAVLAVWRWAATLLGAVPLGIATVAAALGIGGLRGPARLGADAAAWWSTVPGHELIAGPLDGLSNVASWPSILPAIGEWCLGVAIVAVAFLVLARAGIALWGRWDRREREEAHQKTPERKSRRLPAVEFSLLTLIGLEMAWIASTRM